MLSLLFKSVKVSGACEDVRKHVKISEKVSRGVKLCQKVSGCYVMVVCNHECSQDLFVCTR